MMRSLPGTNLFRQHLPDVAIALALSFSRQLAAGCKGTAELFFKIDTVRHHHDTTPLRAVMKNQAPC